MLWFLLACVRHPPVETPARVAAAAPVATVPLAEGPVILVLRAGSAFDPPGREGLAWVTAHAVADPVGVAVDVGPELVVFSIPAQQVTAFAAALGAAPSADAVAAARTAAVAALDALDCRGIAERAWDSWIFLGHPYGHPPEGRRGVLGTLTATEAAAFQEVRYVRNAAVLGVPTGTQVDPSTFSTLRPTLAVSPTPSVTLDLPTARVLIVTDADKRCAVVGQPGSLDTGLRVELGGDLLAESRLQPRRLAWLPVPPDRDLPAFTAALLGSDWTGPWRSSRPLVEPVSSPLQALADTLLDRHPWPSLDHPVLASGALPSSAPEAVTPETMLDPARSHVVLVLPPDAVPALESFSTAVVQPVVPAQELFR